MNPLGLANTCPPRRHWSAASLTRGPAVAQLFSRLILGFEFAFPLSTSLSSWAFVSLRASSPELRKLLSLSCSFSSFGCPPFSVRLPLSFSHPILPFCMRIKMIFNSCSWKMRSRNGFCWSDCYTSWPRRYPRHRWVPHLFGPVLLVLGEEVETGSPRPRLIPIQRQSSSIGFVYQQSSSNPLQLLRSSCIIGSGNEPQQLGHWVVSFSTVFS